MRRLVVAGLAVVSLIGVAGAMIQGDGPPVVIQGTCYSKDEVAKAIDLFRQACRPLGKEAYWSELVEVRVETNVEFAPHRLARGWTTGLHLMLRVPDRPTRIPAFHESTGVIGGQTLHYDLGGGSTPGFLSSKRVSQYLCGAPVSQEGKDTFKAVPTLVMLKGVEPKGK